MATVQKKVDALLKQVEQGTKEVFESEKYKQYLATMSKFHQYSANNIMLILKQCPEATHVAGYVAWQKNFNRQVVRPGAIKILAYTPKTIEVEVEKRDGNGAKIIGEDGNPVTETQQRKIPYFKVVNVFDISCTEGEPLPNLVEELQGNVNYYDHLWQAINACSRYDITFEEITNGAKGNCNHLDNKIVINTGMSQAQTVKTAIHEMAHAELHDPQKTDPKEIDLDSRTKEVQAESVAYIVCQHYGIDTSDYSFGYIAGWSSTKEPKQLQESLSAIQKEACNLITKIDEQLEVIRMSEQPQETEQGQEPIMAI